MIAMNFLHTMSISSQFYYLSDDVSELNLNETLIRRVPNV